MIDISLINLLLLLLRVITFHAKVIICLGTSYRVSHHIVSDLEAGLVYHTVKEGSVMIQPIILWACNLRHLLLYSTQV